MPALKCHKTRFLSPFDEAMFFGALKKIPAAKKIEGTGFDLLVSVPSRLSNKAHRELLGLFSAMESICASWLKATFGIRPKADVSIPLGIFRFCKGARAKLACMDPSIVFGGMKIVCLIALLSFLVGCGRSELTLAAIQKAAARSEVIILADVRKKDGKDSLFAREVLKGRLSPEFRFRIGEEIDPQFEHSLSIGRGNKPTEQMLIFYRPQMGVMTCSRMLSCSQGQIQALHGPEADLAAFVAQLKKEANSEDSVAPKRAPTPRSN